MAATPVFSTPLKMRNPIQTYAWGSRTAIAELTGEPMPTAKPQAELWMGAHPRAPSLVWFQQRWQALDQLIGEYPAEVLGEAVANAFGHQLPFLFKVLAADKPLSIQAHPDQEQAEAGFARENEAGIDLASVRRNYKDPNHKPECLCALTRFTGLCGFRSVAEMMSLMSMVWPRQHNHLLTTLTRDGIRAFFSALMGLDTKQRLDLVNRSLLKSDQIVDSDPAYAVMAQLHRQYPGDIGVISPLMLNLVELQPGEAITLPARQLHAYLSGTGIELMANSDNVLRGGLTPKHIDPQELMRVVDFNSRTPRILTPVSGGGVEQRYMSRAQEFALSIVHLEPGVAFDLPAGSVSILLCTQGRMEVTNRQGANTVDVRQGESVLVPAALKETVVSGNAVIYRATINIALTNNHG